MTKNTLGNNMLYLSAPIVDGFRYRACNIPGKALLIRTGDIFEFRLFGLMVGTYA